MTSAPRGKSWWAPAQWLRPAPTAPPVSRSPSPLETAMSELRLPIHPYAELFPLMSPAEFDRLCDDILHNGLQEEIVVHEGQVLEGRHRYLPALPIKCLPPSVPITEL